MSKVISLILLNFMLLGQVFAQHQPEPAITFIFSSSTHETLTEKANLKLLNFLKEQQIIPNIINLKRRPISDAQIQLFVKQMNLNKQLMVISFGDHALDFCNKLPKETLQELPLITVGAFRSQFEGSSATFQLNIPWEEVLSTTISSAIQTNPYVERVYIVGSETSPSRQLTRRAIELLERVPALKEIQPIYGNTLRPATLAMEKIRKNSLFLFTGLFNLPEVEREKFFTEARQRFLPIASLTKEDLLLGAFCSTTVSSETQVTQLIKAIKQLRNGDSISLPVNPPLTPLFNREYLRLMHVDLNLLPPHAELIGAQNLGRTTDEALWQQNHPRLFVKNPPHLTGNYLEIPLQEAIQNFLITLADHSGFIISSNVYDSDSSPDATQIEIQIIPKNEQLAHFIRLFDVQISKIQQASTEINESNQKIFISPGLGNFIKLGTAKLAVYQSPREAISGLKAQQASAIYYPSYKQPAFDQVITPDSDFATETQTYQVGLKLPTNQPLLENLLKKTIIQFGLETESKLVLPITRANPLQSTAKVQKVHSTPFSPAALITLGVCLTICLVYIRRQRNHLNKKCEEASTTQEQLNTVWANEKKYRAVFNSSNDAMLLMQNGIIIDCNRAAVKMLQVKDPAEIINKTPCDFSPPTQPCGRNSVQLFREFLQITENGDVNIFEWQCRTSHGKVFPIESIISPTHLDDHLCYSLVWRDISKRKLSEERLARANAHLASQAETLRKEINERRTAESQLLKAKKEAENANRAKSQFLTNMSYELRSPLNAILGYTEILSDITQDHRHISYLDSIRESSGNLLNIINDILDLSRLEAGIMKLNPRPCKVFDFFEEIFHHYAQPIADKKLDFEFNISPHLPYEIMMDDHALNQVISNLINNSIKFTEKGTVTLQAMASPFTDNHFNLTIRVSDSGFGIPDEMQDNIFNAFVHQPGQMHAKLGGTGLGLAILKRIIELMGGTIQLESSLGLGTKFTIHIPNLPITNAESPEPRPEQEIRPRKAISQTQPILIVDDIELNRELIKGYLEDYKLQFITAANGKEAVDKCIKHQPQVVLMDLKMPVMTGEEAAQVLRDNDKTTHIPLIAISASDNFSGRHYSNLFDLLLRKPVNKSQLVEAVSKFTDLVKQTEEIVNPSAQAAPKDGSE